MFEFQKRMRELMDSMSGDNYGQSVHLPPPRRSPSDKNFGSQLVAGFMDYASNASMLSLFGAPLLAGSFGVAPQDTSSAPQDNTPSIKPDPIEQPKLMEVKPQTFSSQTSSAEFVYPPQAEVDTTPQTAIRVDPPNKPEVAKAAVINHVVPEPIEQRPQPSAKPTEPKTEPVKKFDNSFALNFLASRYSVGSWMKPVVDSLMPKEQVRSTGNGQQTYTYEGSKSSRDESTEQPQPSPKQDSRPSHPFRLFRSNMPEGDIPNVASKTQQNVVQTNDLSNAVDTAAEQLLYMLDRIAYRLASFNQRLAVIESIFDRSE